VTYEKHQHRGYGDAFIPVRPASARDRISNTGCRLWGQQRRIKSVHGAAALLQIAAEIPRSAIRRPKKALSASLIPHKVASCYHVLVARGVISDCASPTNSYFS
jgi:hypothetical protein